MKDKVNISEEVSRMKNLFGYKAGKVISEQATNKTEEQKIGDEIWFNEYHNNANELANAILKIKDSTQYYNVNSYLNSKSSMDIVGAINKGFESNDSVFVQKVANYLTKLGFKVDPGIEEKVMGMAANVQKIFTGNFKIISSPTQAAKSGAETPDAKKTPAVIPPAAFKFVANDTFPLKFGNMGEKVGQLQTALDIRNRAGQPNITKKFYTATEAAVKAKFPDYNRETGVTEDMFNQLVNTGSVESTQKVNQAMNQTKYNPDVSQYNTQAPAAPATAAPAVKYNIGDLSPDEKYRWNGTEWVDATV